MKKIYKLIAITLIVLLFGACGGNGEGNFDTGQEKIIIVQCDTNTTININTNDLLVKDDSNTIVKIIDDSNGTKTICTITGNAHIIREN